MSGWCKLSLVEWSYLHTHRFLSTNSRKLNSWIEIVYCIFLWHTLYSCEITKNRNPVWSKSCWHFHDPWKIKFLGFFQFTTYQRLYHAFRMCFVFFWSDNSVLFSSQIRTKFSIQKNVFEKRIFFSRIRNRAFAARQQYSNACRACWFQKTRISHA